ncbi:tetratricopeptide repeat-containing sensor histidine kinase [Tenacibaculum sp. 190130A14a]
MKKKIYTETINTYQKVDSTFPFYYHILKNLGGISLEQEAYQKAILYFERVRKSNFFSKNIHKSSVIHDIGIAYFHLSNYTKATEYLNKALQLQEENKDTIRLIGSYMDIANVYYEQYKDNIAIPFFKKAYDLSKKTNNFEVKRKASLNMAIVEENRKDLAKSLIYRKEYEKWKDAINNQQNIWNIAQFEKKLALSEKEKQINILEAENRLKSSQRNNLIISSLFLVLLLVLGSVFYIQKSKSHQIINSQKKELTLLNKTKDKLFSVVSHDLRSSVNLMQQSNSKLLKNIENENYETLNRIASKNVSIARSTYNLLENSLNWATLQTEQLYFHMEQVDLYQIVQQVAYNYQPLFDHKKIYFSNKIIQPSFITVDIDSLKIIIRNVLDNAIKFTPHKGIITCTSYLFQNNIYFIIEDTGIGMDNTTVANLLKETPLLHKKKNQQEIGTGLGIQLCKTLTAKNNASFHIESKVNIGTKIILKFPKP